MKELDTSQFKKDIIAMLQEKREIVVATCDKDRVTARTVFFASDGLKIYFVTSKAYTKYKQMQKKPNVALCVDNIQIEGIAHLKGHPSQEENKEIIDFCLLQRHNEFSPFLKYKNTVLIEVEVNRIELWRDHRREYIDLKKNEAYRIG